MVVGFTSIYATSAYHQRCMFQSCSWRGILDTTLCNTVCQWFAAGQLFSLITPICPTNKTHRHDIIGLVLKVALNTIYPSPLFYDFSIGFWNCSDNVLFFVFVILFQCTFLYKFVQPGRAATRDTFTFNHVMYYCRFNHVMHYVQRLCHRLITWGQSRFRQDRKDCSIYFYVRSVFLIFSNI